LTTIPDANFNEETYRELLALDDEEFTLEKIDHYFKEIIKENEYNIENYNLLLNKNDELENIIRDLEDELKQKNAEYEKIRNELEQYKPDISTHIQKRIASNYAECKIGYYLYIFECEYMKYKCSISRQSDFEILETNLKNIDKDGKMIYFANISYPMSEKIMMFLLKKSVVLIGNNKFEGSIDQIKKTIDITVKLEKLLIECHDDLDKLSSILDQKYTINNNESDPETPIVKKAKRAIDQIDIKTGEVIKTHESIEAAGRSLGLDSGSGIGIALRENRQSKGFLWRYTGISKEEQFEEQPVIKICCKTGEKTYFKTIADSARDINISAPALRRRILTNVHLNNYHWVFNKTASHYT
jgi:predicted transcriptional regulator